MVMRATAIPFAITYSLFFALGTACDDLVTTTPLGRIRGNIIYHNGIPLQAYLGIPYAIPPLGDLRFRKPVPVKPWDITLQAQSLPTACVQYSVKPYPSKDTTGLTVDCLYLNIWVPERVNSTDKKSVMFWIHTGGFRISSSKKDIINGMALAAEGDVIVVTSNYRLGAEGFFYSGTDDAPGNVGLWDIVEALKWVSNNIESFGGDRNSITLFGHSAGAMTVGMFTVSPVTRRMIKRAIMFGGSPANLFGKDNDRAFQISQNLSEAVGCNGRSLTMEPQAVVECMRSKDPFTVAVELEKATANNARGYYPRFGDELLPEDPREAVVAGDFEPVDLLIGTNTGEGSPLLTESMSDVFGFFGEKRAPVNLAFGEQILRDKFKSYPDPEAVVRKYLSGVEANNLDRIRFQVFNALGDYSRTCPIVYFAENFAKKGASVYFFFYVHVSSNSPWAPWMLAVHGEEVPFVFGYPLRYPMNYTDEEQHFSRVMLGAMSNFAKTGKPANDAWPKYTKQNPVYPVLDVRTFTILTDGPHSEECDFFRKNFGFQENASSGAPRK